MPDKPLHPDTVVYQICMTKIRDRIGTIQWLQLNGRNSGIADFLITELTFLQFRKILELIAYSSLTANRERYAAKHTKFGEHWKAVKMLADVENVNPHFYPMAVKPPISTGEGRHHFEPHLTETFTRDDFIRLYDASCELLHMRNPFSAKDPIVDIGYSVAEWVARIQRLLAWHMVQLENGSRWVVQIPPDGPVHLWPADPNS